MTGLVGTSADWYLMRASGFVALILLTITACLGVANFARMARGTSTRAVAALVHRNVSLLTVVFLVIHVLTAISDKYVNVPAISILVPGASGYDPRWVGLGALSIDLLIAVVVTSLLRARLRPMAWRVIHWLAYLCWPSALFHAIGAGSGTGTDTGAAWSTAIYLACGVAFGAAVATRLVMSGRPQAAGMPFDRPRRRYQAARPITAARAPGAPSMTAAIASPAPLAGRSIPARPAALSDWRST